MTAHVHDHEHSAAVSRKVKALIGRLEERGVTSEQQLDSIVESFLAKARPENGYRVVARAWTDPAFKTRLLDDGNSALAELGIDLSHWAPVKLRVVENTEHVHNLIVCTLCSCYPRMLLGIPPDWYKSRNYRSRAVREPRDVLAEFGTVLPDGVEVRVHDSTADMRYIVLPMRPPGTEGWSEEALAGLVTRDAMIGVTLPRSPASTPIPTSPQAP
jgi:nitrile hydratase